MSQVLHPLYGELITDLSVAQSIPGGPGLYEGGWPRVSGSNIVQDPSSRGLFSWRADTGGKGDILISENAAVSTALPAGPGAGFNRVDLLVGVYEWIAGPTNWISGVPTGVQTAAQQATYAVIQGTAIATAGGPPVPPTIPVPYSGNKRAVGLARINWVGNTIDSVEPWDPTDFRPERKAAQIAYMEYAYVGVSPTGSWNIVTLGTHPDVGFKSSTTQFKVNRTGYYILSAAVANAAATVTITGSGMSVYTATASLATAAYLKAGAVISFTSSDTASTIVATVTYLGWNYATPISGQLQTFAINNGDLTLWPDFLNFPQYATSLPVALSGLVLQQSGGRDPITWALTGGNLPGQAISGTNLNGSVSAHSSWTVTLQATDSLGRVVSKTITLTVPAMTGTTTSKLLGNPPVSWPYVVDVDLDGGVSFNLGTYSISAVTITRDFDIALGTPTWKTGSNQVSVDVIGPKRVRLTIPMQFPATYVSGGNTLEGGFWRVNLTATDLAGSAVAVVWKIGFNQI